MLTRLLGLQADFILLWTSRYYLTVARHKQKLTTDLSLPTQPHYGPLLTYNEIHSGPRS